MVKPSCAVLLLLFLMPQLSLSFSSVSSTVPAGGLNSINDNEATAMEHTVRRYFEGVQEKDAAKIRSCFGETATIYDVCNNLQGDSGERSVPASALVERCMEFCAAHPDVKVRFLYGPECGRRSNWVVAHWVETATWSGNSCGVVAPIPPHSVTVEGQSRFCVDPTTLYIVALVVTRTFTEWESQILRQKSVS